MLSVVLGVGGEGMGVVGLDLGPGLWAGCTAKTWARGEVVPVRELNAAFRGTLYNLCYLRLAPAQGSELSVLYGDCVLTTRGGIAGIGSGHLLGRRQ